MRIEKSILRIAAMGLVGGAASATAQPYVVNISGATLFQNFFTQASSTNDYIDVDGDGVAGIFGSFPPDNLAATLATEPFYRADSYWAVQYRATGAVAGLSELIQWGSSFATQPNDLLITSANPALFNTRAYITTGAISNAALANSGNPGAAPVTADSTTLSALRATDDSFSGGGIRIDTAISDVPTIWGVRNPAGGAPAIHATPGSIGYGWNPRLSTRTDGTAPQGGGADSLQADLGSRGIYTGVGNGTQNDLFDSQVAYVPIAMMVNYGVGLQETTITDLQHLFVSGRRSNGENLVAVTREGGSGTRNASMNSLGLDPSWAVGDNVGGRAGFPSNAAAEDNLGLAFVPCNKNGSGNMETVVRNHRLAVGYSGAERGVNNSWLSQNRNDVLGVVHNYGNYGGTTAVRPTIQAILDGSYAIGGSETFITLGDPQNENESGGIAGNTHARVRNPYAASYINNILRSIDNFTAGSGDPNNDFMPGQFLARNFVLQAAPDRVHDTLHPTTMVANTTQVASVRAYTLANSVLGNSAYATFNTTTAGKVPTRSTGTVYSDGVAGGANYVDQSGAVVAYNGNLAMRNQIAGDFNGSGARDAGDVAEMLKAWRQRQGGPAWTAPDGTFGAGSGQQAVIEVLGDFDGNGSFNAADVRYFADGLYLVGGMLDRKAGFTAVDTAWEAITGSNNFFGTTKSTGAAHAAGDSRGDVAGAAGTTRGAAPVGADGTVNAADILYVKANIVAGQASGGAWSDLATALAIDLSCDLTGDLQVDLDDLAELYSILGTCAVDYNLDGFIDFFDYDDFVAGFEAGNPLTDFNNDGFLDFFDYDDYVAAFEAGC